MDPVLPVLIGLVVVLLVWGDAMPIRLTMFIYLTLVVVAMLRVSR